MIRWKTAGLVCGLALLHFWLSFVAGMTAFSLFMGRFDTGWGEPTLRERVAGGVAHGLDWPMLPLRERIGLGWLEPLHWVLIVLNSFLWAVGILLLLRWAGKARTEAIDHH